MSETLIRLISFGTIFLLIGFLEWKFPYRMLSCRKGFRWLNNLGVFVIDSITARLLLPILAVGMAEYVYAQQTGLFNLLNLPLWLVAPLGFLALDLAVYAQHWASHNVPWLWRLHRMHHADLDFDMSTAVRFHPIEIVGSMIYKIAVVWLLGIHPNVVLLFEVVLNGTALFNHGNFSIPTQLEKVLRWFVVTPDMHRIHHSIRPKESNSNYGFNFPWWDHLFGTYTARPRENPKSMQIGIELFRNENDSALPKLLVQPFVNSRSN